MTKRNPIDECRQHLQTLQLDLDAIKVNAEAAGCLQRVIAAVQRCEIATDGLDREINGRLHDAWLATGASRRIPETALSPFKGDDDET